MIPLKSKLGPGPEFDLIRELVGHGVRGSGDDCAFLGEIALSCDLTVEDVHFCLDWVSPLEVGFRAAVAGLSDLAAVGAEPSPKQ